MNLKLVSEGAIKDAFGTHRWKTYTQIPTEADRIRSMTDEELADFLNSVMIDATRHGSLGSPLHVCGGEGVRTLDWLRQETKEGEMWG